MYKAIRSSIDRVIDCLLQMHIAQEETKFGLDAGELEQIIKNALAGAYPNVRLVGLMGMATFTPDQNQYSRPKSNSRRICSAKTIF